MPFLRSRDGERCGVKDKGQRQGLQKACHVIHTRKGVLGAVVIVVPDVIVVVVVVIASPLMMEDQEDDADNEIQNSC